MKEMFRDSLWFKDFPVNSAKPLCSLWFKLLIFCVAH
jgi:hypothetical protein